MSNVLDRLEVLERRVAALEAAHADIVQAAVATIDETRAEGQQVLAEIRASMERFDKLMTELEAHP